MWLNLFCNIFFYSGTVKLPGDRFPQPSSEQSNIEESAFQEFKTVHLSTSEALFAEIRDCNFSAVGPRLSRHAKSVVAQYDERHAAKTVGELKQFVQKIPQMEAYKQSVALRKYFVLFYLWNSLSIYRNQSPEENLYWHT